jgi:hypothetical protein
MAEHLYPRAHKSKNMLSSFAHGRIVINDETHRLRFEGVLRHLPPGPTFSTTYFDLTLSTASAVARCGLLNCSCLSDISVADFVEFVDAAAAHTQGETIAQFDCNSGKSQRASQALQAYAGYGTPD